MIIDRIKGYIYKKNEIYKGKKILRDINNITPEYGLKMNKIPVIVSMASYVERYDTIIPTLKSLLQQTQKPDRIIVWLDKEIPENSITEQMKFLEKYGVEYRFTDDDLKPHKKYFYAMQQYNDAIIITVDDDLIYSKDMIESLLNMHKKYPNCICARRVHKMKFDKYNNILPYKEWKYEYRKERTPSFLLCATGGGGTLYPAGILLKETFEIDKIKKLCMNADDIWLKFMEILADVPTVWVPNAYVMPYAISESQKVALNTTNTNGGGNDMYIRKILNEYPEILMKIEKIMEKTNNGRIGNYE